MQCIYVCDVSFSQDKEGHPFHLQQHRQDLEGTMLNKLDKERQNSECFHLHVKSKKAELKIESRMVVTRGCGEMGDVCQRV